VTPEQYVAVLEAVCLDPATGALHVITAFATCSTWLADPSRHQAALAAYVALLGFQLVSAKTRSLESG
jgi:hypothetical protein